MGLSDVLHIVVSALLTTLVGCLLRVMRRHVELFRVVQTAQQALIKDRIVSMHAVTQVAAAVLSVVLCLAAGADLFAAVGLTFSLPLLGSVLTGVLVSRGANYISDLAGRLTRG